MTASADTNTAGYPIWLGEDNQLCWDETKLDDQVVKVLKGELTIVYEWENTLTKKIIQNTDLKTTLHLLTSPQYGLSTVDILCECIELQRCDLVDFILGSVGGEELYELLQISDGGRHTPLHRACIHSEGCTKKILRHVNQDQLYQLLQTAGFGYPPLVHIAVYEGLFEFTMLVQQTLSPDQWYQLLNIEHIVYGTPLHTAVWEGQSQIVKMMQESVTADQWYQLLQKKGGHRMQKNDVWQSTPLHWATEGSHGDIVTIIHGSVTPDQWYHLLQLKSVDKHTVLQAAALRGNTEVMEAIKESVTDDEWIDLLSLRIKVKGLFGGTRWIAQRILDKYRKEAKLERVMGTTNRTDQRQLLQAILEQEHLDVDHIKQLSPHSPNYIIPYNQERSKRYGLVLFSSLGRPGADEEATKIENSLESAGCDVTKLEWSESEELELMIESSLEAVARDASLLIVSVMSHGSRGSLDANGEAIPVNRILQQFTHALPPHVPLIVLIQACQDAALPRMPQPADEYESDPAPTQISDPHSNQHITLTRPHTVLLLATVRGGVAYRGVFTSAMADEFRSADGNKDIYTMFNYAVNEMKKTNPNCVSQQNPEFRSVTDKVLILPPAQQLSSEP